MRNSAFLLVKENSTRPLTLALTATLILLAIPHAHAQTANCRSLLAAQEVAKITGLRGIEGPDQTSGNDPKSQVEKGVTICLYQVNGSFLKLSVYDGRSLHTIFDSLWRNKKGTQMTGVGEDAYFDAKGLYAGIARAKGRGLTLQYVSGFMTKRPSDASLRSWTEQSLKLVASRL
jgi:hypothetical protein